MRLWQKLKRKVGKNNEPENKKRITKERNTVSEVSKTSEYPLTPQETTIPPMPVRQQGEDVFDFAEVTEADSSALAVMLGWLRAAELSRSTVRFANIPAGVRSLAELYGVAELLPLA